MPSSFYFFKNSIIYYFRLGNFLFVFLKRELEIYFRLGNFLFGFLKRGLEMSKIKTQLSES